MSGGNACKCAESKKPVRERNWVVTQRYCNHSAFNGYHRTYSEYSTIICLNPQCPGCWRTKASFVALLRDGELSASGGWAAVQTQNGEPI